MPPNLKLNGFLNLQYENISLYCTGTFQRLIFNNDLG